jgi:nitrate reductase NapAB chaperone NapD
MRMAPHRRQFIRGKWMADAAASAPARDSAEIASLLVQAQPEHLGAVQAAIEGIAGAEIAECDPYGKLVVILDSSRGQSIGDSLTQISLMPHVLSATISSKT